MALVKQDKPFFIFAAIFVILGQILTLIQPLYIPIIRYDVNIHGLAFAFGTDMLSTNTLEILDAILIVCAYNKFRAKKGSKAYRLFPATVGEKCANIIIDFLLIMAIGYVIKIVSCLIFSMWMGDITVSLDAIKGIFINRKEGYGMITAPFSHWVTASYENGHELSYNLWPLEEVGIPWPTFIHDWTPYPLLAFGLNLIDFLINSFFTILLTTMFVIVKTNKKFRQTIEGKIVLCCVAILVLASAEVFLFDSWNISNIIGSVLTLLYAIGPWCWMSMYGWMIQAAILLVFNALAIYYMYHKIKTI